MAFPSNDPERSPRSGKPAKPRNARRRVPHQLSGRGWSLHNSGVAADLPRFTENAFHGVFCDPPYGLGFMDHDWDRSLPAKEVWAELLRVCRPGASLVAFGGARTFHRLACHIEDAGWVVRDTLCWLYGQGFPKSHSVSKAMAKRNAPAGPWDGYGTALKPAWEPIIVAMKPLDGSFAGNAQNHGCGGLNIDGCRVGSSGGTARSHQPPYPVNAAGGEDRTACWARTGHSVVDVGKGRWPANVLLDEDAARLLDRQAGKSRSRRSVIRNATSNAGNGRTLRPFRSRLCGPVGYDDEGGPSRFFYVAKASRSERRGNPHPSVKPLRLCEYVARLILPPNLGAPRRLLVPFAGSGSEMIGALKAGWDRVTAIEQQSDYCEIANRRLVADYAPLRVLVYENDEGKTCVEYDRPSSLFGQFGNDRIAPTAAMLDKKLDALAAEALK